MAFQMIKRRMQPVEVHLLSPQLHLKLLVQGWMNDRLWTRPVLALLALAAVELNLRWRWRWMDRHRMGVGWLLLSDRNRNPDSPLERAYCC